MKISVCTTFHQAGYEKYGKKMIQSFLTNWPADITLYVYAEDCVVEETAPNLVVLNLHEVSPELVKFKEKWRGVPKANGDVSADPIRSKRKDSGKGFKWDAVRFSHKVYSIFHCAKICKTDILFWMDADMICHSPIDHRTVGKFCSLDIELGYLGREGKFSECGLYSMNINEPIVRKFLDEFQRMYDVAEQGIFELDEWHDSFVFDVVRKKFPLKERNWSKGIITGEGHPLINSAWGAYLDHLKGDRKDLGRSKPKDLKVQRTEAYWK